MDYINRHGQTKLLNLFKTYKVVLLTGARQVGKTRLLQEVFKNYKYVSLDDYDIENMIENDPNLFLSNMGIPFIIDEVQRIPEIFRTIKLFVDRKDSYGQYILSGSQLFKLLENAGDSLAGRVAIMELPTLSYREIVGVNFNDIFLPTNDYLDSRKQCIKKESPLDIWKMIFRGMYPELQNPQKEKEEFYKNYVNTYLERDVRTLVNVQNLMTFYKFLVCVAARTGQIINYSNIADDIGVDADTIKKWISVLETSNIIYLLRPYANKELKKIFMTPKLYFRDVGLCAYLTKWQTVETMMTGAMNGAFFETFVISEIIKSYANAGYDYRRFLSFYNGKDGKKGGQSEIDLIIEMDGYVYPVEIKMRSNPNYDDVKNFEILNNIKDKKIGKGGVICFAEDVGFINDKINVIPCNYL